MEKTVTTLSPEELARLGGGILGYVREIDRENAKTLLGGDMNIPVKARLFALYNADGTPISISGSLEAAVGSAIEHELTPASVH
jgi:hypothetical protein